MQCIGWSLECLFLTRQSPLRQWQLQQKKTITAKTETPAEAIYLAAVLNDERKIFVLNVKPIKPIIPPINPPEKMRRIGRPLHIHSYHFRGSTTSMILPSTESCGTSSPRSRGFHIAIISLPSLRRRTICFRFGPFDAGWPLINNFGSVNIVEGRTSIF